MSEKRPDSGPDEEMKRKLKLDRSASGPGDHQETLKLKSALKPARGKRNQDKDTKKRVTFDLPSASGSVGGNQESLKAPVEKRSQDKGVKRKEMFDGSVSGLVAQQEWLKLAMEKRNQVDEEDRLKAKAEMGERSRSRISSMSGTSSSKSKGKGCALVCTKSLTYEDLHSGTLRVPASRFSEKKREGNHGRMLVPCRDNQGVIWELEVISEGLSLNWHKFVKAHGLRYNDVIFFFNSGPDSNHYIIEYGRRSRSSSSSKSKGKATALVCTKSLTYEDLLSGTLRVPVAHFSAKKREGRHGRMMVPCRDNQGVIWELEATSEGLSLNWHKFVKAHGLRYNDGIFFFDSGPDSKHFIIEYGRRTGPQVQSGSK